MESKSHKIRIKQTLDVEFEINFVFIGVNHMVAYDGDQICLEF